MRSSFDRRPSGRKRRIESVNHREGFKDQPRRVCQLVRCPGTWTRTSDA